MASFLTIFNLAINLVFWIIIIQAVLSWLVVFGVVNLRQSVRAPALAGAEPADRPALCADPPGAAGYGRDRPDAADRPSSALYALQVVVNNNLAPYAYG